jgi:hypothetical protein
MTLLGETEVELPPERGGTRCRVRLYAGTARQPAHVVLTELDENPGLPVSATVRDLAAAVRACYADQLAREPVWVEEWRGRAVSALVRGLAGVTTYMSVDLSYDPPVRSPLPPAVLAWLQAPSG